MGARFDGAARARQGDGVPDRLIPAVLFRLTSVFALTSMGALIKLADLRGAGLAEILFFRQAFALPVVVAAAFAGPGLTTLRTTRLPAHILRTAIGLSSMSLMFSAVIMLPLAEATTLQFTVPIFATILGAVVLREATGWHRWAAVIVGFIGVVIVAQPGSGHIPLLGAATGLTAALLSATVSILIRHIGKTERPTTTVFYFSLLSLVPLAPLFVMSVGTHDGWTWALLVLIGLTGGVGQIAMTSSLALAPVAVVVPMDYSGLMWATLYGWVLFAVLPTPMTWVGAPIIIASGLYIVWREHRLHLANTLAASALEA
jgi:drug/metabolite transporter (DMT)-like permease